MLDVYVSYEYVQKLPVVILDNLYNQDEIVKLKKECHYLHDKLLDPQETHGAKKDGKLLKKNSGIYLENFFADVTQSSIFQTTRKVFSKSFVDMLTEIDVFFQYYARLNKDNTLLSYYENSDYYDSHADTAIFTICTWLFDEPKKFKGGDFFVKDLEIECKNNRTVIFPSVLQHGVTPLIMSDNEKGSINGRFTISQFGTIVF